jgi:hypothetical protein
MRKALCCGILITTIGGLSYSNYHDNKILYNLHKFGYNYRDLHLTPSNRAIIQLLRTNGFNYIQHLPDEWTNPKIAKNLDMDELLRIFRYNPNNKLEKLIQFKLESIILKNYISDDRNDTNPNLKYLSTIPISFVTSKIILSIPLDNDYYNYISCNKTKDILSVCEHFNKILQNPKCSSQQKTAIVSKVRELINFNSFLEADIIMRCDMLSNNFIEWIIEKHNNKSSKNDLANLIHKINPKNISIENKIRLIKIFPILDLNSEWQKMFVGSIPNEYFLLENIHKLNGMVIPHDIFNKHLSNMKFYQLKTNNSVDYIQFTWNVDGYDTLGISFDKNKQMTLPRGFIAEFSENSFKIRSHSLNFKDINFHTRCE